MEEKQNTGDDDCDVDRASTRFCCLFTLSTQTPGLLVPGKGGGNAYSSFLAHRDVDEMPSSRMSGIPGFVQYEERSKWVKQVHEITFARRFEIHQHICKKGKTETE
jgi:hypothetical protein